MKHREVLLGGRSAIIFVLMFMAILSGGYGRILSNPGDSLFVFGFNVSAHSRYSVV